MLHLQLGIKFVYYFQLITVSIHNAMVLLRGSNVWTIHEVYFIGHTKVSSLRWTAESLKRGWCHMCGAGNNNVKMTLLWKFPLSLFSLRSAVCKCHTPARTSITVLLLPSYKGRMHFDPAHRANHCPPCAVRGIIMLRWHCCDNFPCHSSVCGLQSANVIPRLELPSQSYCYLHTKAGCILIQLIGRITVLLHIVFLSQLASPEVMELDSSDRTGDCTSALLQSCCMSSCPSWLISHCKSRSGIATGDSLLENKEEFEL